MENLVVYLLIAILILLIALISLLGKIAHTLSQILKLARKWHKGSEAERDLRDGKFDEVIERCEKHIEDNPTNVKAHSTLARAYYAKEMWEEARREMEIVAKINPSWKREFTQPYIEEIDKQLGSNSAGLIRSNSMNSQPFSIKLCCQRGLSWDCVTPSWRRFKRYGIDANTSASKFNRVGARTYLFKAP